jgi:glycosyltransferase involved in cell wall biosynthesis
VNPGVDTKIFYPKDRSRGDERPTVLIALNGAYHFKGSDRGLQLAYELQKIAKEKRKDIRIMAYGASQVNGAPGILCQGSLARTRIANLLATEVDVFVDPALNHSYGMPALEAIACGVLAVSWNNRGIQEYLPNKSCKYDTIATNDSSPRLVAENVFNFLFNDEHRIKAIAEQRKVALIEHHDRNKNVAKMAKILKDLVGIPKLNIVVVTPHARKHGGPTTLITMANELASRGHNVKIASVYSDLNPGVIGFTTLPIILLNQKMNNFPECDLVITNSDNPLNSEIATTPKAKRKIMIKLSHNPRFKALEESGLNLKWDAIVTSSQWLADVCENPAPDWNYSPVKAHRVGWYHYNFEGMRRSIKKKRYHELNKDQIVISTLVHAHPSKGSSEAGAILDSIYQHYKGSVKFIGVGEIHPSEVKISIPGMDYVFAPSRDELADIMAKTDIWLSCSHTEGLGRMALEAMTGAAACVLTDTGAEFVIDGKNALVRQVGDLDGLANAINTLIADIDLRKAIGFSGYETAKKMADSSEFVHNLEQVIASVL